MAFDVSFTLRDAYTRTTTRRFTNTRADIADAITDTATMLGYLEALSKMAVVKTEIIKVTTYSTSPESGANVDAGGTLHARLNNGKLYPMRVPALDPALVNTDGSVKLGETAVTNFVGAFASGQNWTVSEGNTVSAVEYGELDR